MINGSRRAALPVVGLSLLAVLALIVPLREQEATPSRVGSDPLKEHKITGIPQLLPGSVSRPRTDRSSPPIAAPPGISAMRGFPSTPAWDILRGDIAERPHQPRDAGSAGTPAWCEFLLQSTPGARELFETGMNHLRERRFTEARLAFQTLIRTFSGDKAVPIAYWAIALSWYRQGGYENLLLASDQLQNWLIFFRGDKGLEDLAEAAQIDLTVIGLQLLDTAPDEKSRFLAAKLTEQALSQYVSGHPGAAGIGSLQAQLVEVRQYLAENSPENTEGMRVLKIFFSSAR